MPLYVIINIDAFSLKMQRSLLKQCKIKSSENVTVSLSCCIYIVISNSIYNTEDEGTHRSDKSDVSTSTTLKVKML